MSGPRVAVAGVGYMGALHAEKLAQIASEGLAELVGVLDTDPVRAKELGEKLGVPVLPDVAALVAAADAAIVAVPTIAHAELAGRLLEAGLHVLIEKPIAPTREQARALIDTARARERVLQVGHVERYSRAFRTIAPMLERPRFIEAHRIGPYPARATDVSVVLDLMIHDLDIVASLAGSEVTRVEAIGVPVLSQTEDIANARVSFANGCILNLTASRVSLERMRKVRIFQPDAYISIDFGANKITVVRREGEPGGPEAPRIEAETIELDAADALLAQDRAFVEAVTRGHGPEVTGEDGLRALDLALRIQESIPPLEDLA